MALNFIVNNVRCSPWISVNVETFAYANWMQIFAFYEEALSKF